MNFRERFRLLTSMGVHPSIILGGCQDRSFIPLVKLNSPGSVCVKLSPSGERGCTLNYPSSLTKVESRSFPQGTMVAVEGVHLVDLEEPENLGRLARASLYNMISVSSPEPQVELMDPPLAGFSWGKEEERVVTEGMWIGTINRPGGMASVVALSRYFTGAQDFFEKNGYSRREILNQYRETVRRAMVTVDLWEYKSLSVNVTRPGLSWLNRLSEEIGHVLEVEEPKFWDERLSSLVSSFTPYRDASELLVIVMGEREEVEGALARGESLGLPSFFMGRVKEKGIGIRRKKGIT